MPYISGQRVVLPRVQGNMTSGFRPGHPLPFDYILPVMLGFAYER